MFDSRILTAVLHTNGHKLTDWCKARGIQPSQLYAISRKGEKYDKVRKDLSREVKLAKRKIVQKMDELEALASI